MPSPRNSSSPLIPWIFLFGGLVTVALWLALLQEARHQRDTARRRADRDAERLALVLETHTRRVFQAVEITFARVETLLNHDPVADPAVLAERLTAALPDTPELIALGIYDRHGQAVATAGRAGHSIPGWPSQAELRPHKTDGGAGFLGPCHAPSPQPATLFVVSDFQAYRDRGTHLSVGQCLRIADAASAGSGLVALVDLTPLTALFANVQMGDRGRIELHHRDGTVLIGDPTPPVSSAGSSDAWISTVRPVVNLPFTLAVSLATSEIFKECDWQWRKSCWIGVFLTMTLLGLTHMVATRAQRERAALQELETSRAKLTLAQRLGRIGHYEIDHTSGTVFWSDSLYDIWGQEPGRFVPTLERWYHSVHPDDRQRVNKEHEARKPVKSYRVVRPDGVVRHIESECIYQSTQGRLWQFGVATDVTDRREREFDLISALQQTHLLVAALEANPTGIAIVDPILSDMPIVYVNKAFTEITGYGNHEVMGSKPEILLGVDSNRTTVKSIRQAVRHRRKNSFELIAYRKDGQPFWMALTMAPVFDGDQQLVAIVGGIRDITNDRKHQERLRQVQKLEALGQMAGGIAHELNNLLQPVMTFSNLTAKALVDQPRLRVYQEAVLECSRRAREIIRNVLTFAHGGEPKIETVDLTAIVHSAVLFTRDAVGPTIAVIEQYKQRPILGVVNQTELFQVLLNLFNNAVDAMDHHGEIVVSLHIRAIKAGEAETLGLGVGSYAVIGVRDHGCGMDKTTLSRIFEPFYTTKPVGQGTGLGLSIAYGIVTRWKGTITADSELGRGAHFRIFIPVGTAAQAEPFPL